MTETPDPPPAALTGPLLERREAVADLLDAQSLVRVLRYGTAESRRRLAQQLLSDDADDAWRLLAQTVRSREPWPLRARCLEVLGVAAGLADEAAAARILAALTDAPAERSAGMTISRQR